MRLSFDEVEARRRVDKACELIRSAYRLAPLNPKETLTAVRAAITEGAEQMAEDTAEAAR